MRVEKRHESLPMDSTMAILLVLFLYYHCWFLWKLTGLTLVYPWMVDQAVLVERLEGLQRVHHGLCTMANAPGGRDRDSVMSKSTVFHIRY